MSKPAARMGDPHVCPMVTGTVPHVGGPILPACAPTVLTGSSPQARVTDMCTCVGPPDMIVAGAFTVLVAGMPAARLGDQTMHGGTIIFGLPTVLIGDSGSGGGGTDMYQGLMQAQVGNGNGAANDQARAMIAAARDGSPFCEICPPA